MSTAATSPSSAPVPRSQHGTTAPPASPAARVSSASPGTQTSPVRPVTRLALREVRGYVVSTQVIVFLVMIGLLLGLRAGALSTNGAPWPEFTLPAVQVASIMAFIQGIALTSRTPALLRSGLTRSALTRVHLLTGTVVGLAITCLLGPLTLANLVLTRSGLLNGAHIDQNPYLVLVTTPAILLAYCLGATICLLCHRQPWWLVVVEILVGLNVVGASLVARTVSLWGTAWGGVWLAVLVVVALAVGPVGMGLLLRGYQPRR